MKHHEKSGTKDHHDANLEQSFDIVEDKRE